MLSIGEMAHASGVSRRMLRHWEDEGLLSPASVDPDTGHRRYQDSQVGRVRAIAELRGLGFGLTEIGRLLDPRIEQTSLVDLLERQAATLEHQITEASARLTRVRHRLDDLRDKAGQVTMNTTITALPGLTVQGASTTVLDESEIHAAVTELRGRLPHQVCNVLLYDGTADDRIVVIVGSDSTSPDAGLEQVEAPAVPQGVSVTFETAPESIADAWVLIDAELDRQGLTSHGVYRQLHNPDGRTTLQAPVRELH